METPLAPRFSENLFARCDQPNLQRAIRPTEKRDTGMPPTIALPRISDEFQCSIKKRHSHRWPERFSAECCVKNTQIWPPGRCYNFNYKLNMKKQWRRNESRQEKHESALRCVRISVV